MHEINYEVIDLKDEFTLLEAACYWVDIPAHPSFGKVPDGKKGEVKLVMDMLKRAAADERIKCAKPPRKVQYRVPRSVWVIQGRPDLHHEYVGGAEYKINEQSIPPTFYRPDLRSFAERIGQKPPFLFPAMRKRSAGEPNALPEASGKKTDKMKDVFQHSDDFRSVTWKGKKFTFTSRQAQVIELLYDASQNNTPDVGKDYILEQLDSPSSRLRDTFKNSPVWGTLIIRGKKKGTYRLNL